MSEHGLSSSGGLVNLESAILLSTVITPHTKLCEAEVREKVLELLEQGLDELQVLTRFQIPVEEVVVGSINHFDQIQEDDKTTLVSEVEEPTKEELQFEKVLKTIDFTEFKDVKRIESLNVGDLVDFDIRGFLRFTIVKIVGTINKGGTLYAQCVVNATKLDSEKGKPLKKFILNKEYSIELPLVSGQSMIIASKDGSGLSSLRIITMKQKKQSKGLLSKWFTK